MFDKKVFEESQQKILEDKVKTIDAINHQIAEFNRIKSELEQQVFDSLEHDKIGQKSYIVGEYAVTIKTGVNYSINLEEYEVYKNHLSDSFNPVIQKTKYEVNKKLLEEAQKYGSQKDLETIAKFITEKPAKLYVAVKPNA
jgi:ribosomal protein S17E